ncbi:hypothetical protein KM043_014554 [Ampulex compressa]|nr:hypothetical protein KM043_014554 [Ampulex compressa]
MPESRLGRHTRCVLRDSHVPGPPVIHSSGAESLEKFSGAGVPHWRVMTARNEEIARPDHAQEKNSITMTNGYADSGPYYCAAWLKSSRRLLILYGRPAGAVKNRSSVSAFAQIYETGFPVIFL